MTLDKNFAKALIDIKDKGWGFISGFSIPDKCDLIKKLLIIQTCL